MFEWSMDIATGRHPNVRVEHVRQPTPSNMFKWNMDTWRHPLNVPVEHGRPRTSRKHSCGTWTSIVVPQDVPLEHVRSPDSLRWSSGTYSPPECLRCSSGTYTPADCLRNAQVEQVRLITPPRCSIRILTSFDFVSEAESHKQVTPGNTRQKYDV